MGIHPGCGCPTTFVAKIIAIFDLVFGLIGIFWFVYILEGYGFLMEDPSIFGKASQTTPNSIHTTISTTPPPRHYNITSGRIISIDGNGIILNGEACNIALSGFYTMANLIAFVLLLSAAHERCILKLKIWIGIRLSIFMFKVMLYSTYLVVGASLYDHIPHMIFMIIHAYGIWVAVVLIREIREERRRNANGELAENPTDYNYPVPVMQNKL